MVPNDPHCSQKMQLFWILHKFPYETYDIWMYRLVVFKYITVLTIYSKKVLSTFYSRLSFVCFKPTSNKIRIAHAKPV